MKTILMSVQPKWLKLIIDGIKQIEIRKTVPNVMDKYNIVREPFKVLLYCTKNGSDGSIELEDFIENYGGKVVGHFICKDIGIYGYDEHIGYPNPHYDGDPTFIDCGAGYWITMGDLEKTCLTEDEFNAYGNKKTLYGYIIDSVETYDRPKMLTDFFSAEGKQIRRAPQSWMYCKENV